MKPSDFESSLKKTYEDMVKNDCIKCGGNRESHHEFVSGERETRLLCYKCGKKLTRAIDPYTKKISEHLWHCKKCAPHLILSIG
jgi:hypothetical protein